MSPPRTAVVPASAVTNDEARARGGISLGTWVELTKPRLSLMTVVTATMGYLAARPQHFSWWEGFALLAGTSLAAGGAAVLNQYLEREADARMKRTRTRPLPSGRVEPEQAAWFGGALAGVGLLVLAVGTNVLATLLTALTLALYLAVYTPLKRRTTHATLIGTLPGALPALIGWEAAGGTGAFGWYLFAILTFWQMPHFYAICWLYREDYARGGFRMLAVQDRTGKRLRAETLLYAGLLLAVVVGFGVVAEVSGIFIGASGAIALAYLLAAWRFRPSQGTGAIAAAKQLFLGSLLVLPLLFTLAAVERLLLS